ncbi:MAG: imidazole glycerol phosphate synthase subunit HisF [Candidatus Omnitrophica bacterium]|nr:imidazole glycerol phosphate synthase subunit HisF [Candidatus Omnitrophota bacterium]
MLKRRLIPVLFLKNGLIVRSETFSYHQNLGNPLDEVKRYNDWNVDELIYVDISREKYYDLRRDDLRVTGKNNILDIIREISKVCFAPLTFGGGIRTLEDIRERIRRGADKVTINTAAIEDPSFITRSAREFGSQCIVVSIDYRYMNGAPKVYKGGAEETDLDPVAWAVEAEKRGAGEIFLNAIDRDGMANGYDVGMIGKAAKSVTIPVIACGGAGTFRDLIDVARNTTVSAVAAGNIFHFTEMAYPRAKDNMIRNGIGVRTN